MSILAGVRREDIQRAVGAKNATVYRIMTSTACAISQANCAIVKPDVSSSESDEIVRTLTDTFGQSDFIAEYLMDAFSGVAGCGIAFGYTFIQAMADGAVKMGIPRQQAIQFAAQTLQGSASMVIETGKHPIQLRDEVCSAGGSTICGVHALERNAVPSAIIEAVEVATRRNTELSK
jgi:pyrroline-5-carboxylate reductase